MNRAAFLTCFLLAAPALADSVGSASEPNVHAEPVAIPADRPAPPPPPVVKPRQASGIAVDDDREPHRARALARGLLLFPRFAYWAAIQPVRGVTYVYDRYDILERLTDATFTDDRRFGIYPVAGYDTTYGFSVGARLLYKDIFGEGERIKLRADYGGEFRYAVGGKLTTGHRFGWLRLEARTDLERRTREHFYGIGNGDKVDTLPEMPVDPTVDDAAFATRFSQDVIRNVGTVDVRFTDAFHARSSGAVMTRTLGAPPDPMEDIALGYDTSKLIGFDTGVHNMYLEEELVYDSRRPSSPYATQTIDAAGWLARSHVGVARGIDTDTTHYLSYGGELQKFFDLYDGTRSLGLRGMVEAVAGTDGRTDGKISFVDLPRLGGSEILRGYPSGRFRDRIVWVATAEYTWEVLAQASAYAFFDAGQPLESYGDAPAEKLRFGYGAGLQLHTKHTFMMRSQIAFSREGDVLLNLVFSPAFGRQERAGRY